MTQRPTTDMTLRQKNTERTKSAILKSAKYHFARRGYAEARLRDIAAKAKVNQALIARYYGSKIKLFESAFASSLNVVTFTQVERHRFGETIAELFCKTGQDTASSVPMLIFAASDTHAREAALRILKALVIQPLEVWFGEPHAADRAAQLLIVVTGFFTFRVMLPLEPLSADATPEMRTWFARCLQDIVDH